METTARHTLIGAFAIAVLAIGLLFLYWVAGVKTNRDVKEFYVIFQGSVSGLSEGGGVLFNGLKVGDVRKIALNPGNPTEVRALIKVDRLTPVHTDTRVLLSYQGLTGVASIELTGGSPTAPLLKYGSDGDAATMYAERTLLQNITDRAQETITRVNELLIKFDAVVAAIDPTSIGKFTTALGDSAPAIQNLMQDSAATAKKLNALADKLDTITTQLSGDKGKKGLIPEATETIVSIRKTANSLNKMSDTDLKSLMIDTRKTVNSVDRFVNSLERHPNQLIFGKPAE